MKEKEFENICRLEARRRGFVAVKVEKNGHTGIPDDLFLSPDGRYFFVEFKRPDGKGRFSPAQKRWQNRLEKRCFSVQNYEYFLVILEMFES